MQGLIYIKFKRGSNKEDKELQQSGISILATYMIDMHRRLWAIDRDCN